MSWNESFVSFMGIKCITKQRVSCIIFFFKQKEESDKGRRNIYFLAVCLFWIFLFWKLRSGTASTTSRARYGTTQIWRRKVDIHRQVSKVPLFS